MNSLSALELKSTLRHTQMMSRWTVAKDIFATLAARFDLKKSPRSHAAPKFHLGEAVYHGGFGRGLVVSLTPDGRLMIKFDGRDKSQPIFPSLLERVNHR
jgi:hypothetical protein